MTWLLKLTIFTFLPKCKTLNFPLAEGFSLFRLHVFIIIAITVSVQIFFFINFKGPAYTCLGDIVQIFIV